MALTRAKDASLADVLGSLNGEIIAARIAYPEVLHVEILDRDGGRWLFATQDADWAPADADRLVGLSVVRVEIDETSGELTYRLSDASLLEVRPAARAGDDDPPNWELISPGGFALEFGPGSRWRFSRTA